MVKKYRHRWTGERVDAEFHPSGVTVPDHGSQIMSPCYTVLRRPLPSQDKDTLIVWDKETFEYEHESFEETERKDSKTYKVLLKAARALRRRGAFVPTESQRNAHYAVPKGAMERFLKALSAFDSL